MASQVSLLPNDSISVTTSLSELENTPASPSTVTRLTSRVHKRQKRDPVWSNARKPINGVEPRAEKIGDRIRAIWYCPEAGCEIYSTVSTAGARNHLKSVHDIIAGRKEPSRVVKQIQSDISSFTRPQEELRRNQADTLVREGLRAAANTTSIQQALLRLVIYHDLPLSFVEWPEVHTLVNAINYEASRCIWTTHQTTANRVWKTFNIRQAEVKLQLQMARSLIHLTTDTWHSPNNKELQAITAHFVDSEGRLRKALLSLPELNNGHSGVEVAPRIIEVLEHYEIKDKVGYLTADNATANDTLCRALSNRLTDWDPIERRLRCVGHIINLAMQSFSFSTSAEASQLASQVLDLQQPLVDDEELNCSGWIQQPALQKVLRFVKTLRRSDRLFNAFKVTASKALRKPVVTRSNSYYNTLVDALELRVAYTTFVLNHNDELADYELSAADWHVIEQTTTFLEPFKEATKQCEGDYVNLDKVQTHMDMLRAHYTKYRQIHQAASNKAFLEALVTSWYSFDKYYSVIDETGAYSAAILLDPRLRKSYLVAAWQRDWVKPGIERARQLWLSRYKQEDATTDSNNTSTPLSAFDEFMSSVIAKQRTGRGGLVDEFDRFIEGPAEAIDGSPLQWWLQPQQQRSYPQLSQLAIDTLSAPAMSAEGERVFSATRRTISWTRARLSTALIERLECIKHWQRSGLINEQFVELADDEEELQFEEGTDIHLYT